AVDHGPGGPGYAAAVPAGPRRPGGGFRPSGSAVSPRRRHSRLRHLRDVRRRRRHPRSRPRRADARAIALRGAGVSLSAGEGALLPAVSLPITRSVAWIAATGDRVLSAAVIAGVG